MDVKIFPSRLDGIIEAASSKAMAHRAFIAAALADGPTEIYLNSKSADVSSTINCLKELGASVTVKGDYYSVTPIWENLNEKRVLDVGESAATLKFLLPLAAFLGETTFSGQGKFTNKSAADYLNALKGCTAAREKLPFVLKGKLKPGVYKFAANASSQFVSGLLFVLPILDGDSEIIFDGEVPSPAFLGMTLEILTQFGVKTVKTPNGYKIFGGQKFVTPSKFTVEGDYSCAAYYLGANAFGNRVRVTGLNPDSLNEDKKIKDMLLSFNAKGTVLDVTDNQELVPILAVCACYACSRTVIKNAKKVKLKEGERLEALAADLNKLGGNVNIVDGEIVIEGKGGLKGGAMVDSFGDPRIAMALSFAATLAENPVTLLSAQAAKKVYPNFYNDFMKLGGKCSVT